MVTKLFRVFYETQGLRLDILLPAICGSAACELARDALTPILGHVNVIGVIPLCQACTLRVIG